jgi:hypothetical protein
MTPRASSSATPKTRRPVRAERSWRARRRTPTGRSSSALSRRVSTWSPSRHRPVVRSSRSISVFSSHRSPLRLSTCRCTCLGRRRQIRVARCCGMLPGGSGFRRSAFRRPQRDSATGRASRDGDGAQRCGCARTLVGTRLHRAIDGTTNARPSSSAFGYMAAEQCLRVSSPGGEVTAWQSLWPPLSGVHATGPNPTGGRARNPQTCR